MVMKMKGFPNGSIDAFELWCWRRLLRVPGTARRSNQSILKEISPECSLEGLMLKLKLQSLATWCEELTHLKRPWCWERLKAGRDGDDRIRWLDGIPTQWKWVWVNSGSWWWTGKPGVLQSMGSQRVGHDCVTELTELMAQWWGICLPSRRHGSNTWVRKILWRRKWQPTPVFLPGNSYFLLDRGAWYVTVLGISKELNMTEQTDAFRSQLSEKIFSKSKLIKIICLSQFWSIVMFLNDYWFPWKFWFCLSLEMVTDKSN